MGRAGRSTLLCFRRATPTSCRCQAAGGWPSASVRSSWASSTSPRIHSRTPSGSTPGRAVDAALAMEAAGADIIDLGGESTRPGAVPIDADEELRRVSFRCCGALAGRLTVSRVDRHLQGRRCQGSDRRRRVARQRHQRAAIRPGHGGDVARTCERGAGPDAYARTFERHVRAGVVRRRRARMSCAELRESMDAAVRGRRGRSNVSLSIPGSGLPNVRHTAMVCWRESPNWRPPSAVRCSRDRLASRSCARR